MSKTKTKFELLTNKALVALARECGLSECQRWLAREQEQRLKSLQY